MQYFIFGKNTALFAAPAMRTLRIVIKRSNKDNAKLQRPASSVDGDCSSAAFANIWIALRANPTGYLAVSFYIEIP